jgi:hypothetical protein
MKIGLLTCVLFFGEVANSATPPAPLPNWSQLESDYQQENGQKNVERSIFKALPPGTDADLARKELLADGATCRRHRSTPWVETCLIHQYSLLDGAADDIRWTITMRERLGRIISVSADRYVDRHGTA